jgi:phosphatidylserine/phosphatidylglycerophosphate/cardiolipin synthase-like enzyme
MAANSPSPPNSQDPPKRLIQRTAQVSLGATNTLRVPGDPFRSEQIWFNAKSVPKERCKNDKITEDMPPVRQDNEVKYLIDGREAFQEMVDAIESATDSEKHFIYFLNWWFDDSFDLPKRDNQSTTLRQLLSLASDSRGVMVRAMLWDQLRSHQNDTEFANINSLFNGAAILDDRGSGYIPVPFIGDIPYHVGSQHQKVLCVNGENGLIAFCGGIDFNADRIQWKGELIKNHKQIQDGAPMHDVHCRIRGPATSDLLKTFVQRWNDHPDGIKHNQSSKGPLIVPAEVTQSYGSQIVQIGRTFGDNGYGFTTNRDGYNTNGERTAREMIRHAIDQAKRFIYVEDQYFVGNPEVEASLIQALNNGIRYLIILIPHWRISDLPLVQYHRREFISRLRQADNNGKGNRVQVFYLEPQGVSDDQLATGFSPHTYIHAKTWIIDDEFAVVGSVNTNRRSWSHDSEIAAGIYDTSSSKLLTYRLAHWLRIKLWQEHLNMMTAEGAAELADGVASAVHWLQSPPGARVQPYNVNEPGDVKPGVPFFAYDLFADPA